MTKKEFGKQLVNGAKIVTSTVVGTGAMVVTDFVFRKYAPAETAPVLRRVTYSIGTKGVSIVTGAVAADLTTQELNNIEAMTRKRLQILKDKKESKEKTK